MERKPLGKATEEPTRKERQTFITFTDLYEMKQEGLENLLLEKGEVFILSKKIPPIKLTLADLT
jgi:hypothetical protein